MATGDRLTADELVLAGLAAGGTVAHTPVQVQKMFFLIQENISDHVGSPFRFKPYDYGPFSSGVYQTLDGLVEQGLVEPVADRNWTSYRLTERGEKHAASVQDGLGATAQSYLSRVSAFVRSLSFNELVATIYEEYPEMAVNSVFRSSSD